MYNLRRLFYLKFTLIFLSSAFLYSCDSCDEGELVEPIGEIVLTQAAMEDVGQTETKVNLSWNYLGDASQLQEYILEYSLHHGEWIPLLNSVANTENSVELFFPQSTFLNFHSYAWRVRAVGQSEETMSCYREAFLDGVPNNTGLLTLPTTAYDDQTVMTFSYTPDPVIGTPPRFHPVLEQKQGNTWVTIFDQEESSLVSGGVMSLNPSVILQSGETYRVHGHYSTNIAEGNRIVFTYAPAHPNACDVSN